LGEVECRSAQPAAGPKEEAKPAMQAAILLVALIEALSVGAIMIGWLCQPN
jgi:hypothetical protein